MKKQIFSILLLFSMYSNHLLAQVESDDLYPVNIGNKWGYINGSGEIVISPSFKSVGKFVKGLAPARLEGTYGYINTEGELMIQPMFDYASEFSQGLARVWKNNDCYFIDEEGLIVIKENGFKIKSDFRDGYAAAVINLNNDTKWIVINQNGEIVEKKRILKKFYSYSPKSEEIYAQDNSQLKFTCKGDTCGYVNLNHKFVWRVTTKDSKKPLDTLDVDFMLNGYFYAFTSPEESCYGCWPSSNYHQKIVRDLGFQKNTLGLRVDTSEIDTFAQKYVGYRLYLYNTTADSVVLKALDSRLNIKAQALNGNGQWDDIEYLLNSFCGNSHHELNLPPKRFWEFTVPLYNGAFKTSIRLVLIKETSSGQDFIYSNAFSGGVNPAQFWREQRYSPVNFMDPYGK